MTKLVKSFMICAAVASLATAAPVAGGGSGLLDSRKLVPSARQESDMRRSLGGKKPSPEPHVRPAPAALSFSDTLFVPSTPAALAPAKPAPVAVPVQAAEAAAAAAPAAAAAAPAAAAAAGLLRS